METYYILEKKKARNNRVLGFILGLLVGAFIMFIFGVA